MNRSPALHARRTGGRRHGLRGFTLIEILVALAIGLVILLALTVMFARNSGNQAELERQTRQLEGARFSLDALTEDVMHAGYYGEFNPDPLAPDYTAPDPCATALTALGWNTAVAPVQMPVAIQGIDAATAVTCLQNRMADTEAVVVRHAGTADAIDFAAGNTTNLFLQVSRCTLDSPQSLIASAVPAVNPQATFTLRRPDCVTVNDRLRRVTQRTYYIASCNVCSPSDGVPTLKRVEMINGALRTMAIAEGVENLQVEYGLDTNDDGSPDSFNTMGSGVITGVDETVGPNVWQNVVSARVHLLTRSTEATPGFVDARTYSLGPDITITPTADRFKRTLMTSTVRLMNVGMRRE